jgi:hypothetical protein
MEGIGFLRSVHSGAVDAQGDVFAAVTVSRRETPELREWTVLRWIDGNAEEVVSARHSKSQVDEQCVAPSEDGSVLFIRGAMNQASTGSVREVFSIRDGKLSRIFSDGASVAGIRKAGLVGELRTWQAGSFKYFEFAPLASAGIGIDKGNGTVLVDLFPRAPKSPEPDGK